MLPFERNNYSPVDSIDMHNIYLNTQLRTISTDISIVKIDIGKDMGQSPEYQKCIFRFYEHQYLPYYDDTLTAKIFNTYRQHSDLVNLVSDF